MSESEPEFVKIDNLSGLSIKTITGGGSHSMAYEKKKLSREILVTLNYKMPAFRKAFQVRFHFFFNCF